MAIVRQAPAAAPLRYRRCRWCRSVTEHSRVLCPVCAGADFDEETSLGFGAVTRVPVIRVEDRSTAEVRQVCTITVDDGFTVFAELAPDQYGCVKVGARVQVEPADDGAVVPARFRVLQRGFSAVGSC